MLVISIGNCEKRIRTTLGYVKTMQYDEHGSECGEIYTLDGTQTYSATHNETTGSLISYSTPIEDIAYSYDGLCRLTTKTRTGSSFSKSITYSYLNNSSNTSYTTPLVSQVNYGSGEKVCKYTYDSNGNITKITNKSGTVISTYEYDAIGRLTRENNNGYNTIVYAYDSRGNRTSKKTYAYTTGTVGTVKSTVTASYAANNRMSSFGGASCIYDSNGNPTTYKGATCTWTRGRMLSSYAGATYTYDDNGIRIKKVVGSTTTNFILDGERILAEYSGGVYKKFFYDESGIAGMIYSGNTYYFRKNLQGDVDGIYDSCGNLIGEYVYDAWGNILSQGSSAVLAANPFRYRGYYYDTESGFYYLNSRYYDPATGRFLNEDATLYLDPSSIDGLNLYIYCINNPVSGIDPTGHEWYHWLIGAAVVVGLFALTCFTAGGFAAGLLAIQGALCGIGLFSSSVSALAFATVGAATAFVAYAAVAAVSSVIDWVETGSFLSAVKTFFSNGGDALVGTIGGAVTGTLIGGISYSPRQKKYGNYILYDADGREIYVGYGDRSRMMRSYSNKMASSAIFRPASSREMAFAREALYINEFGGAKSMGGSLLNKINSPGLKYIFWWL